MHMDMTAAIEQIRTKGKDTFTTFVDKLSNERNLMRQRNKERGDISELLENLKKAKQEWIVASTNYEFAQDEELIDYYVYAIKAAQLKYDYLLKKVKEVGGELTKKDFYELSFERDESLFNYFK